MQLGRPDDAGAFGARINAVFGLKLVDLADDLALARSKAFSDLPRVSVHCGPFEEIEEYDCIVSPANNPVPMDGGINLVISHFFGWDLMERVKSEY